MRRLSERLRTIASLVPPAARVADIGCDHAYLLLHLAQQERIAVGIGSDLRPGPLAAAQRGVELADVQLPIQLRLGDGFSVLQPSEVDTAVVAGMGGARIVSLLEQAAEPVMHGIQRLLLQPQAGAWQLRRWLFQQGWQIEEEHLLEEKGHLYEVIAAVPGDGEQPYRGQKVDPELLWILGPLLWQERHPSLARRWHQEWQEAERILAALAFQRSSGGEKDYWLARQRILRQGEEVTTWQ